MQSKGRPSNFTVILSPALTEGQLPSIADQPNVQSQFQYFKWIKLYCIMDSTTNGSLFYHDYFLIKNIEAWIKWPTFCSQRFQMHFLKIKLWYFDSNFAEVYSWGSSGKQVFIGSVGLASNKPQAITWDMLTKFHDTIWHH